MLKWYQELFSNYAKQYDNESYTQGTLAEIDFIEQEINFDKTAQILDIGCGTGRHSIELAKRGYSVFGFDLSENQLQRARQKAKEQNVTVTFEQHDACDFSFPNQFSLALMLCEGAFPLMETDEMNFQILTNAYRSLKVGGKFIFTTLNGLFPLFHSVKDFISGNMNEGNTSDHTFDLMTFRDHSTFTFTDDSGVEHTLQCNERYYVPSEISWLLKSIGFVNIAIHGCNTGAFSRNSKLATNDYEMLVIAEKW